MVSITVNPHPLKQSELNDLISDAKFFFVCKMQQDPEIVPHRCFRGFSWTIVSAPHRPKKSSRKLIILFFIKIAQRQYTTSCWNQHFRNRYSISFLTIYEMTKSINVGNITLSRILQVLTPCSAHFHFFLNSYCFLQIWERIVLLKFFGNDPIAYWCVPVANVFHLSSKIKSLRSNKCF